MTPEDMQRRVRALNHEPFYSNRVYGKGRIAEFGCRRCHHIGAAYHTTTGWGGPYGGIFEKQCDGAQRDSFVGWLMGWRSRERATK